MFIIFKCLLAAIFLIIFFATFFLVVYQIYFFNVIEQKIKKEEPSFLIKHFNFSKPDDFPKVLAYLIKYNKYKDIKNCIIIKKIEQYKTLKKIITITMVMVFSLFVANLFLFWPGS